MCICMYTHNKGVNIMDPILIGLIVATVVVVVVGKKKKKKSTTPQKIDYVSVNPKTFDGDGPGRPGP